MLTKIYEVLVNVGGLILFLGKFLVMVIFSAITIIVVTIMFAVAMLPFITSGLTFIMDNATTMWSTLFNAGDAMNASIASGWPAGLTAAVQFVNYYIPLGEMIGMVSVLLAFKLVVTIVRITKSFLVGVQT